MTFASEVKDGFGELFVLGALTVRVDGFDLDDCSAGPAFIDHPPFDTCTPCDDVDEVLFRWDGPNGHVIVSQKADPDSDEIHFEADVTMGEAFLVDNLLGEDKLGDNGKMYVNDVEVKVNCSKPFGPGLVVDLGGGDTVTVLEASSKDGGPLRDMCPVIVSNNQFGTFYMMVRKPKELLVPTLKDLNDIPIGSADDLENHFKCYEMKSFNVEPGITVLLEDQFHERAFKVKNIKRFCNPVNKNEEGFVDGEENIDPAGTVFPDNHLTCYEIDDLPGFCEPGTLNAGQSCTEDEDCCGFCDGGLDQLEVIYTGDPSHDPATGPDCVDFELLDSDIVNPGPHKLCNPEVLDPAVIAGAPFFPNVVIEAIPGDKLPNPTEAFEPGGGPLLWSLHTSCSSPIFEGQIFDEEPKDGFGLLFKVGANTTSVNGGQIAEECLPGSCNSQAGDPPFEDPLFVANQFGNEALLLEEVKELCVPSEKTVGNNCALVGEFCNDAAECCVVGSTCDANVCTDPAPAACIPPFGGPCFNVGSGAECCDPLPPNDPGCGVCIVGGTCFVFDPAGQPGGVCPP